MSSQGASRLYCLNNEHLIPGNELEEKRVLTELSRLKNISRLYPSKDEKQEIQKDNDKNFLNLNESSDFYKYVI